MESKEDFKDIDKLKLPNSKLSFMIDKLYEYKYINYE